MAERPELVVFPWLPGTLNDSVDDIVLEMARP